MKGNWFLGQDLKNKILKAIDFWGKIWDMNWSHLCEQFSPHSLSLKTNETKKNDEKIGKPKLLLVSV